jgi:hypothetical protein
MLSSFDNVVTVYIGMSQHVHTSVAITTTLIHLLITNTNNAKYITSIFTAEKNWSQEIK